MSRTVNGAVGTRFQDGIVFAVSKGSHRSGCAGCILHPIGVVMARTGRVHEIVNAVFLQHKGSFEEVGSFGVRYQSGFGKTLHVFGQSANSATKPFVNAPGSPIEIDRAVIINE